MRLRLQRHSRNLLKLESYLGEGFRTANFYLEAEAHPGEERMQRALEALQAVSEEIRVLGTYPKHSFRNGG